MLARRMLHAASSLLSSFFAFDSSLVTFTAGMAKRTGQGPFAAAPIMQGSAGTLKDQITLSRGAQIANNFFSNFDSYQGTLSFWITPEWDGDDNTGHNFLYLSSNHYFRKDDSNYLEAYWNGVSYSNAVDISSWTAGTTYHVVFRWDINNTLDGGNSGCFTINDSHTFDSGSSTSNAPSSTMYFGALSGASYNNPDAIIEGLTIYRRPLYDGTYGVDVGNGDEINLIYNSGTGTDPTEITGSWDVTFCLPTNASTGALTTGTGEAWSHPHSSAVLTDTFCETTYGSSAWSTKGTPSTAPADLADADKVFNWGYDWTCDADAEGIEQSLTSLSAGENYVMRCIAHVNDANDLRIRVTDDTNTADILTYTFGASSSRTAPGVAIITWELPTTARNGVGSDCTAMTIAIEGTAASQQVYLHQAEIQENLIDNPSMETGSGDPWVPDGWATSTLDAGDSEQETTVTRSGSSSLQYNSSVSNESMYQNVTVTLDKYYVIGTYAYSDGSNILRIVSSNVNRFKSHDGATSTVDTTAASWTRIGYVGRVSNASVNPVILVGFTPNPGYFDDAYCFQMDDVSLTVTPASEANSTETTGLRVDGDDTCTQPVTGLTATNGEIKGDFTPRHAAADIAKFGTTPYLIHLYEDANNYLSVYWSAANTMTLAYNANGAGEQSDTWDATGAWDADATKTVEVNYGATNCTLDVGGTTRITIVGAVAFASTPTNAINWGADQAGANQFDGTIDAPA